MDRTVVHFRGGHRDGQTMDAHADIARTHHHLEMPYVSGGDWPNLALSLEMYRVDHVNRDSEGTTWVHYLLA